jgi:hypothetical protein
MKAIVLTLTTSLEMKIAQQKRWIHVARRQYLREKYSFTSTPRLGDELFVHSGMEKG